MGKPPGALHPDAGLLALLELRADLNTPGVILPWLQPMDLSDVANCCCEFDKYERVRLGQGEPRARYVPGRGH